MIGTMAKLEAAECKHDTPCSCIKFEGQVYKGLESVIDDLVEQRDNLLCYIDVLEHDGGMPPVV
jgi:hypothetical protein